MSRYSYNNSTQQLSLIAGNAGGGGGDYLPLSGGTVTGDIELKANDIDASKSDNDISVAQYVTTYKITDKDDRELSHLSTEINPNGKVSTDLMVENYDTQGDLVAEKGIEISMNKSGNLNYTVDDENAFREAIKTIEQVGNEISANTDLNTITTAGTYTSVSNANAATLVNRPMNGMFKMIVMKFNSNPSYTKQICIAYNSFQVHTRFTTNGGSSWSDWVMEHPAKSGDTILYNFKYGNLWGQLKINTVNKIIAYNFSSDGGSTWNGDIYLVDTNYLQNNTHYLSQPDAAHRITESDDLDDYTASGTYQYSYDANGVPANCPFPSGVIRSFKLVVDRYGPDSKSEVMQRITMQNDSNALDYCRTRPWNSLTWGSWKQLACKDDVAITEYDLDTIHNILGAKNLFNWDLHTDIFYNVSNTSHTITDGVLNITTTSTSENINKGCYIISLRINDMLADLNGQTLTVSCDIKFDDTSHNIGFGLDSSESSYSIGTTYTHIEKQFTLDTSKTNNHLHFYTGGITSALTYHVKNIMIRPATISSQQYVPYSLTNQQILQGLNASIAKTGKSILPAWRGSNGNTFSTNGLTFTFNPLTNEITVNGTATATTDLRMFDYEEDTFRLPKGDYYLSGCASGGDTNKYSIIISFLKLDGSTTGNYEDTYHGRQISLNDDMFVKYFIIRVFSGQTLSNKVFKPMLRPAWATADFEPCEDIHKGNCYVGTCATAGGTKDKVAYVDGYFVLRKGVRVAIKFSNTNTYDSSTSNPVTLNVNNTGAKNIWGWATHSGAGNTGVNTLFYGVSGRYHYYMYDGTYWVYDGFSGDNNNTNFLRNDASSTLATTSPVLQIKATNVDTAQSNNGVTTTQYPAFVIQDKNAKVTTRLESIVQPSGNIATYLYTQNYNTSTGSYFNGGIFIIADKSGNILYNLVKPHNFNAALGMGYGTCSTAEATVAKVVTMSNYKIAMNGYVTVKFTYNVPANATMNINNEGVRAIYYRGSAITANIIKAGDLATFIYDGTNYNLIGIDRDFYKTNTTSTSSVTANTDIVVDEVNISTNGDMVSGNIKFHATSTVAPPYKIVSGLPLPYGGSTGVYCFGYNDFANFMAFNINTNGELIYNTGSRTADENIIVQFNYIKK